MSEDLGSELGSGVDEGPMRPSWERGTMRWLESGAHQMASGPEAMDGL